MEGDDESTHVLNSPESSGIAVLQQVRIILLIYNVKLEVYSP